MQRLQKIFVTLILITAYSCGSTLPTSPSIDSGIIIVGTNEAYFVNNQTGNNYSLELVPPYDCGLHPRFNKYIIHSNEDWNKVLLYIRLLENKVGYKTRNELQKVRNSSLKLNEEASR